MKTIYEFCYCACILVVALVWEFYREAIGRLKYGKDYEPGAGIGSDEDYLP